MKTRMIVGTAVFSLVLAGAAVVNAQIQPGMATGNQQGMNMDQIDSVVANFPQPAAGMQQFIIKLPAMADENAHRVSIIAGRMEETDGVNSVGIAGRLMEKNLQGWGYNYYEVEGADGPSISTLIGVKPGTPPVTKFISLPEKLVRYNSRLPLVVYAPRNFEIRYRVFAAGPEQSALTGPSGGAVSGAPKNIPGGTVQGRPANIGSGVVSGGPGGIVSGGPRGRTPAGQTTIGQIRGANTSSGQGYIPRPTIPEGAGSQYQGRTMNSGVYGGPTRSSPPPSGLTSNEVVLSARRNLKIPAGATATVRLYDAMLNGPEDSFASHSMPISSVPATLTLPDAKMDQSIALPAVNVSIYGPNGQLLFVNNQATAINFAGKTKLIMARPGEEDEDY